jgi:hypothetical protein
MLNGKRRRGNIHAGSTDRGANVTPAKWNPDDDDEYGDLSIRKKPTPGNPTLIILLICGVIGLTLLTCVGGIAIVAVLDQHDQPAPQAIRAEPIGQDPEALKLVGAWKGRLVLRGMDREHLYTFRKDGTLREDVFDLRGAPAGVSEARWRFRDGKIEIDWPGAGVEIATARWIDANTMEYRILDHTDVAQNGLVMTFRRQ